ncbi:hypothetical protein [Rhizobium laguerreae]|uniref:hypothetical protein n=1 Tax=Rhizobium laguerreae TaxID=1076926 RepID=UPI001FE40248|nr:hypothetical protein [Rhizobium laguerreae]
MFQVSVVQREGEGILQPMHLKEHIEFAVFLIGGAARKRPLLAEDRHDYPLHRGHQSAAIEEIGSLVKADKASRPIADQPVFGESCAIAPRESREQTETKPTSFAIASSRSLPSSAETPARSACEGENAASSAQSPTARSRLFNFISSNGQLRLGLAVTGTSAKTVSARIPRIRSIKNANWTDTAGRTETKSCAHPYVAALIRSSREISKYLFRMAPMQALQIDVAADSGPIAGQGGRLNLLSKSYDGFRQFLNVAG